MEKIILNVRGMSCEHCVAAVTKAISALSGVRAVAVDLAAGTAAVECDGVSRARLAAAIEGQGYDVV